MAESLVSIIIPTYNRAHLISDTLNSIQNQTHKNWECIVVDDGSTDNTEELLNRYVSNDDRFIFTKRPESKPKGANACRNYGLELSKGQFVNWFDSDDIMHTNKLELQLKVLKSNPESPYCICLSKWFDKETNTDLGLRSKSIDSKKRLEDYCLYNIFWLTTAPLWRRDFIINNQLSFDENLHQSQEYDFHIKALAVSDRYAIVKEPLLTLIKHKEAISSNIYTNVKIKSNIKVKQEVTKKYLDNFSSSGKLKWLEIITLYFKSLLLHKRNKFANEIKAILFEALDKAEVSSRKKISFKTKINFALISYRLTGKGYNLVRPLS